MRVTKIVSALDSAKWKGFEKVRNKTIILTFLYTGIRLKELLNLKRSDFYYLSKELYIKSENKSRVIRLSSAFTEVLQEYLLETKRQVRKSRWLFYSLFLKRKVNSDDIYSICRELQKITGISSRPTTLRHTFIKQVLQRGMKLKDLQVLLGHSQLETTSRYLSLLKNN